MITETSVSDKKTIERYIDQLVATFGLPDEVSEKPLRTYFDEHNIAKSVQFIKHTMRVPFRLKVTCYSDSKYPDSKSLARISMSDYLHLLSSVAQSNYTVPLEIKESGRKHFYMFVQAISHEVAHLVLFGSNHHLKRSEVATDLCALIFGFGELVRLGRSHAQLNRMQLGYLTDEQFLHAMWYIQQVRNRRNGVTVVTRVKRPQSKKGWWDTFIGWFKK